MLFLTILLPLLGFICGSLFGRFLGLGVCLVTTTFTFTSFFFSFLLLYDITSTGNVYILNMGQ